MLPDTGEEEMKWEKSKKKKRKGSKVAKETKTELKQSVYSAWQWRSTDEAELSGFPIL